MRCVVQRVTSGVVEVVSPGAHGAPPTDQGPRREIGAGLVVLAGLQATDGPEDLAWMARKIAELRIFCDAAGKMNLSVKDVGGSVLLVPNFTVAGDARKGRRPSFDGAMPPARAAVEFAAFVKLMRDTGVPVRTGEFGADMLVTLTNDGPVTIVVDGEGTKGTGLAGT